MSTSKDRTAIALVGAGYVADFYMATLPNHPELDLRGVYDRNPERLRDHAAFHGVETYASFDEVLGDRGVEIVVNLTNPRSHYDVTRADCAKALEAFGE